MGVIHRDLKPENILYSGKEASAIIKISDFGLARFVQHELCTTACGTPSYIAPEVLSGKGYSYEVDYWSIGVTLYIMLCGFPPFFDESHEILFKAIQNCEFEFTSPYWDEISDSAKDLIKSILVADPETRLNAEQILAHPWIQGHSTPRVELPNVTKKDKRI